MVPLTITVNEIHNHVVGHQGGIRSAALLGFDLPKHCVGTVLGHRTLAGIPEIWFDRVLAIVLALLGVAMIFRGMQP
jgi:uncharacterized membrane protein YfcA